MLFLSAPSLSPAWHGQAGGLALSQCQGATAGLSALIRSRQKKKKTGCGSAWSQSRTGQASSCVLEPTAKPSAITGEV